MQLAQSESDTPPLDSNAAMVPPPNPMELNGSAVPPPNPLQLRDRMSQTEKTQNKLRTLSAEIPRDNSLLESANLIDDDTRSPPQLYASTYQKRNLEKEAINEMHLSDASQIIATSPKGVAPVAPKLGFLGDIQAFKAQSLRKTQGINVNRHEPNDNRTKLLSEITSENARNQLTSVSKRKVPKKKEDKKSLIYEAMAARRPHFVESSDEEESDWGSESE